MHELERVQTWIEAAKLNGKPVLLFCVYGTNRLPDEYFREIYAEVRNDFSMLTITDLEKNQISMPGEILRLPSDAIIFLKNVDIFIVIDNYKFSYPESSFVAAFPHSFHAYSAPYKWLCDKWHACFFDAYFTTTPQTSRDATLLQSVYASRIPPQNIRRKRKEFLFIPVGCPRVAAVQRTLEGYDCVQDSLLYAPTNYDWHYEGEIRAHMVRDYGVKLIGDLLDSFPEYRIVFRPCATTWTHDYTRSLIAAHQGHPRFAVSRDFDHAPEFARAAVVLTDYSNIGEVFAFASLRPEIRMYLEHDSKEPRIMRTGVNVRPDADVPYAVRLALNQPQGFWQQHISASYGKFLFAPSKTFPRIRHALLDLSLNNAPKGSAAVPRDWRQPAWTEMDYLKNIFWGNALDSELLQNFMEDFPEDPVPLVLYLCMMQVSNPSYHLPERVRNRLQAYVDTPLVCTASFSSISRKSCIHALKCGQLRAVKNTNPAYGEAIAALLQYFDDLFLKPAVSY